MGKRLFAPPARVDAWSSLRDFMGLCCRVRSNFSHQGAAQETGAPEIVRATIAHPSVTRPRSNRGLVLPRDRIPGEWSPDIVDCANGGISNCRDFLATAAVVRSALGISPSAWESAQTDIGDMSAAVVACILHARGRDQFRRRLSARSDGKI